MRVAVICVLCLVVNTEAINILTSLDDLIEIYCEADEAKVVTFSHCLALVLVS